MGGQSRQALGLALLLGAIALAGGLARSLASEETKPAEPPKPASKGIDLPSLPADAIVVICEQAADAFKLLPKLVVLKPDQYQELRDEIARLKTLLKPEKPQPPSKCHLHGKVEGEALLLKVEFEFVTDRPGAVVLLACGQAEGEAASLDGRPPNLRKADPEGFTVQVDKPGEHFLTLELTVRLVSKGAGRGFDLELPRAAITTLDLELPADARNPRLGGKPLEAASPVAFKGRKCTGPLGPVDRLELSWTGAGPPPGAARVLSAEGEVTVRIDDRQVASRAELTLKVQGGVARQWRLLVPLGAEVKPATAADDALVQSIERKDEKYHSVRTVRLKAPTADPLRLTVTHVAPLVRSGPNPVGPFTVLDATRQTGNVLVNKSVADVQLTPRLHSDMAPRERTQAEMTQDPYLVSAFKYWGVPANTSPSATTGPGSLSLLDLEVEAVQGIVEASVVHVLRLVRDNGGRRWRATTTIEARPVRAGVDRLDVQLPAEATYDAEVGPKPSDAVREVKLDASRRTVAFRLASETLKTFTLTFEVNYPAGQGQEAVPLGLPRPMGVRDRGAVVTVMGSEDVELLAPEAANPTLEPVSQEPHRQAWRADRIPDSMVVGWRPYRPEVRVSATVDLTLSGREGWVRHELRYRFPGSAPGQLALRPPAGWAGGIRVVAGGEVESARDPLVIRLENAVGSEHTVVLEYAFAMPDGAAGREPWAVPLAVPHDVRAGETKVRVWAEPSALPLPPGGAWTELNLEDVAGHTRLPALVLRTQHTDQPLTLRLGDSAGTATVLVERALVRVTVADGVYTYRARYRLQSLAARTLDVDFPSPLVRLGLKVSLDGKLVSWEAYDAESQRNEGGSTARLRLDPSLVRRPAILEFTYQVTPGRSASSFQTTFLPPTIRGEAGRAPTRWCISLPGGWVPLGPEGGPGAERVWGWRNWLLAPRLAVTAADLERWLTGANTDPEDTSSPSVVAWRTGADPLTVTHAPQQIWLLVCSLSVLLPGLAIGLWVRKPVDATGRSGAVWLWPAVLLGCLALAIVGLLWPTVLAAAAFGCQPGLVVVLAFALTQGVLHALYRRRLAFLPSFRRSRSGSVLTRGSSARSRGEPSTVDVPRPSAGGSHVSVPSGDGLTG